MVTVDTGYAISHAVLEAMVACEAQIKEFEKPHRLSEYVLRLVKKPGFKIATVTPLLESPQAYICAYQGSFDGSSQSLDATNMYVWNAGVVAALRGQHIMEKLFDGLHSLKDVVPGIRTMSLKTSPQFPAMMHIAAKQGYAVKDHYGTGIDERYIFVKEL